jgi:hypothetical protein
MLVECVKWGFVLKSHKDLDVWKRRIAGVTGIFRIMKAFPDEEKYGMIHQMRRSAVSVQRDQQEIPEKTIFISYMLPLAV